VGSGPPAIHRLQGWSDRATGVSITRRIAVLGALVVAGAGAAAVIGGNGESDGSVLRGFGASDASRPSGISSLPPGVAEASVSQSFSISGSVEGLFPGETAPLVLTVTNPQTFSLTVTSIATTVKTSNSSCPSTYVKVTVFDGHLHVASGTSAQTTVLVTMKHGAPDACEGTHFPFRYAGLASAARR
jgi:hypothetical protein